MQVFETPGDVSLRIKLPSGNVTVTTADEPRTTVEIVTRGRRGQDAVDEIEITMDERLGGHVVTVEQRDRFRWGPIQISWGGDLECRITCPPGAALDLAGGSTDLRVVGELGDVSVKTASGDVRLQEVRSRLEVKTASGDVSVDAVGGDASVVSMSGDLAVGRVEPSLTARSVSGDVTIGCVGGELGVSTTSGDIEIKSVESGDVRVQSISGDVRIGIGQGARAWVDAVSVSGSLESEIGLDEHDEHEEGEAGGVVPVHVKTVSGDVAIVRASEAFSVY